MPPPNITGQLHLGHALGLTIQDTLIRHHRNQGYDTLYLPGQDHAGSATQDKLTEEFGEAAQYSAKEWEKQYRDRIREQTRQMGTIADWQHERYTMDEEMISTTQYAFYELYHKGLIYEKDDSWYLKQSELAQPILDALDNKDLTIYPASAEARLRQTPDGDNLLDLRDWEISRQGWWGIKMPIWYNQQGDRFIAPNLETAQSLANTTELTQSELIFDTWFTSTLWTFAALGWPHNTELMKKYYPAALLETGEDILYFWGTRMLMMGFALTGKLPYKAIYLHGLIRDKKGQKMSKSKGNGILPEEILSKYGLDATRFALLSNTYAGQDLKLTEDKFITGSRFLNKIWNAAKFINNLETGTNEPSDLDQELTELETNFNQLITDYQFAEASQLLRDYLFNRFCSIHIEAYKANPTPEGAIALRTNFKRFIRILNPIMPSITNYLTYYIK